MTTATLTTQIAVDDQNVAWIAGTTVKVTEVVQELNATGSSPAEIHFQHPDLSLAQIHAALTYYYENKDLLDAEIAERIRNADEILHEVSDAEFRERLLRGAGAKAR